MTLRLEQEAGDQGGAGGGGRGVGLVYTPEVQDVGAILRGEKPKARPGADKAPAANKREEKSEGDHAGEQQQQGADSDQDGATDESGQSATAAGAGGGDGASAARGEGEAAGDTEHITPAELAKALGVKDGELYDQLLLDVDVTGAEGVKTKAQVTLGDLRRGYIGAESLRVQREAFDQERDAQSLEHMHGRRFFEQIAQTLAPAVPAETLDLLRTDRAQRLERERALLYEAVPEWKDAAKHAADRTAMIDYLKPWGFRAADVAAIEDHRIARFLRDQMLAAKRARDAETRARQQKKQAGGEQPTPGRRESGGLAVRVRSIIEQGKAAKTSTGKAEAAGALLREHAKASR